MIRHRFSYLVPEDAVAASEALAHEPAATSLISGGTWVVPELSRGRRRAAQVIDLRRAALDTVSAEEDDGLRIGTCVTYTTLADHPRVTERAPLLARLAAGITGGVQLRNVATAGGSACYASPSSDVPAALVALGARMVLLGPDGERALPAAEFFTGAFRTRLATAELLVAMLIPPQASGGWAYRKLKLCGSSWPIATAVVTTAPDGTRRLVLGGVASTPLTIATADVDARGNGLVEATAAAVTEPYGDELADGTYRARIAPVLARRAWMEASR